MNRIRCFVAVDLSEEIRRRIADGIDVLRRSGVATRWVHPRNLHLTLRFVGEVQPAVVDALREALPRALPRVEPFRLTIAGLGRFPEGGRRPRIIWVGCTEGRAPLRNLWDRVQACARSAGLPRDDKGFSPHITIGRVKSPKGAEALLSALGQLQGKEFGTQEVRDIHLKQSRLTPEGPVYTPLASFPLGGKALP